VVGVSPTTIFFFSRKKRREECFTQRSKDAKEETAFCEVKMKKVNNQEQEEEQ